MLAPSLKLLGGLPPSSYAYEDMRSLTKRYILWVRNCLIIALKFAQCQQAVPFRPSVMLVYHMVQHPSGRMSPFSRTEGKHVFCPVQICQHATYGPDFLICFFQLGLFRQLFILMNLKNETCERPLICKLTIHQFHQKRFVRTVNRMRNLMNIFYVIANLALALQFLVCAL